MKTIEQACLEAREEVVENALNRGYTDSEIDHTYLFKAGVEYAQQWISIDDELPEIETPVLVRFKYDSGNIEGIFYAILRRIKIKDTPKKWQWSAYDVKTYFAQKVIEWQPINLK